MATPTYDLLDSVTLSSSASSVTFSSISQDYRDLVLVIEYKSDTTSNTGLFYNLNSDSTSSNYTNVSMYGNGSSAASGSGTAFWLSIGYANSTNAALVTAQLMDYSATDKHKTTLVRHSSNLGSGTIGALALASRWANTSAVTSWEILPSASTFASGSTFYLYGVAA